MKRTILFCTLALCAVALVCAQGNNRWGPKNGQHGKSRHYSRERYGFQGNNRTSPQEASVSGNLTIVKGMIALVSDNTTYVTMGLDRYTGFIDGLKEGAAVTLEGYALPDPQNKDYVFLRVNKMTLNGKDYELGRPRQEIRPQQNMRPNQMHHQQRPRRKN